MKNSLLLLILLAPFFSSCSTFSNFFASKPAAPPAPNYVAPRIYPEKINLSEVKVESINELPTEPIGVYKGSDGNNYLFLNLNYENSGLSVIEAIKAGEILDNNIIVRDQTGKIIGSDVVNFQAFSAVEKKIFKVTQEIVRTRDGFETPVRPQSSKRELEPEISTSYQSKIYTEKERVPQVIKLNELPPNNSYISINLELVYVEPFLQQICNKNGKSTEPCTFVDEVVTKDVREANKKKLDAIVSEYQKVNDKAPAEKKSPKKFVLTPSEIQAFKDKMKTTVSKTGTTLEGEKTKIATSVVDVEKAKLNYREWNLVSAPKFFQINTEVIKPLTGEAPTVNTQNGNSITPAPAANTNSPVNANTPVENTISKPLPIEGFSDTVTLKNGTVYRNVKANIKETTVLITSQDGKTMEINKSELVSIKK
jgi:hypothetical protein